MKTKPPQIIILIILSLICCSLIAQKNSENEIKNKWILGVNYAALHSVTTPRLTDLFRPLEKPAFSFNIGAHLIRRFNNRINLLFGFTYAIQRYQLNGYDQLTFYMNEEQEDLSVFDNPYLGSIQNSFARTEVNALIQNVVVGDGNDYLEGDLFSIIIGGKQSISSFRLPIKMIWDIYRGSKSTIGLVFGGQGMLFLKSTLNVDNNIARQYRVYVDGRLFSSGLSAISRLSLIDAELEQKRLARKLNLLYSFGVHSRFKIYRKLGGHFAAIYSKSIWSVSSFLNEDRYLTETSFEVGLNYTIGSKNAE